MKTTEHDSLRDFECDKKSRTPLQLQIYLAIKERILAGRLVPQTRLPSSRELSIALAVSRNTVTGALEQLKSEGYIKTKPGAGHYVSDELPDHFLKVSTTTKPITTTKPSTPQTIIKSRKISELSLSSLGQSLIPKPRLRGLGNSSFEPGVPDLKAFPLKKWNQIYHRQGQRQSLLGYDSFQGYQPLRDVLSDYLRSSRGLVCTPEQIIITTGAQQASSIAIQILLEQGDEVYVENPGYVGMRKAFEAQGVKPIGIDVGDQGIDVNKLPKQPTGKLLCITPTHQYPMGGIVPLANRLKILQWAVDNHIWVLEDDYDSEYHYDHKPIAAMQGLGFQDHVIYIGSFSKVLYPGLRLGYLVVPEYLVNPCVEAKNHMTGQTPNIEQATVAEFIESGQFLRHLRKMRLIYEEKLKAILRSCQKHLSDIASPQYTGAGMHIVLTFNATLNDRSLKDIDVVNALNKKRLFASALSTYYLKRPQHQGLVLGFANTDVRDMDKKIKMLRQVVNSLLSHG
ncbi:MAG: PLP-dependent aminotransferase family protein [Pseudomonadales bacterium]|nr:PLP-dependent aminotransferase family protein [Pseudomonadales bacterium]